MVAAAANGVLLWVLRAVFPFDFTGYATDWSGLARFAMGIEIIATGIAIIRQFVTGADD